MLPSISAEPGLQDHAGNFVGEDQAMIWFEHPPICVIEWAKPGKVRQVSSVKSAVEELLK